MNVLKNSDQVLTNHTESYVAWLVPCSNRTNYTNSSSGNQNTSLCEVINGTAYQGFPDKGADIKTFQMRPDYRSPSDLFVGQYDPITGIRTAAILGSALFAMMVYVIYKARCKPNRWTSADDLFVQRYKLRMQERDFQERSIRSKSVGESLIRQELAAMEATAKWIQSQPLDLNQTKKKSKLGMCNICLDPLETPSCPACSNAGSHLSLSMAIKQDKSLTQLDPGDENDKHNSSDISIIPVFNQHYPGVRQYDSSRHGSDWKSKFLKSMDTTLIKSSNVDLTHLNLDNDDSDLDSLDKSDKNLHLERCHITMPANPEYDLESDSARLHNIETKAEVTVAETLPLMPKYDVQYLSVDQESMKRKSGSPQLSFNSSSQLSPLLLPMPLVHPNRSFLSLNLPSLYSLSPPSHRKFHRGSPSSESLSNHSSTLSLPLSGQKFDQSKESMSLASESVTTVATDSGCNVENIALQTGPERLLGGRHRTTGHRTGNESQDISFTFTTTTL